MLRTFENPKLQQQLGSSMPRDLVFTAEASVSCSKVGLSPEDGDVYRAPSSDHVGVPSMGLARMWIIACWGLSLGPLWV